MRRGFARCVLLLLAACGGGPEPDDGAPYEDDVGIDLCVDLVDQCADVLPAKGSPDYDYADFDRCIHLGLRNSIVESSDVCEPDPYFLVYDAVQEAGESDDLDICAARLEGEECWRNKSRW